MEKHNKAKEETGQTERGTSKTIEEELGLTNPHEINPSRAPEITFWRVRKIHALTKNKKTASYTGQAG